MAKRKRLSPAQNSYLSPSVGRTGLVGPGTLSSSPPIAKVASEAATEGALQELTSVLENARAKGLLVEEIGLNSIDETHLVRDRLEQDEEEMTALVGSLRVRGQQTPIEVVALGDGATNKTYGLISGWRRLTAMRRLYSETNDPAFATIKALVIQPESAEEAYVAMVEENEIRVNLSHYERARIAVRALGEGIYTSQKYALQSLFANATRTKRSKIGSFVILVEALDAELQFPTAIPEKLGLGLARAFSQSPEFSQEVARTLREKNCSDAEGEQLLLSNLLAAHEAGGSAEVTETNSGPVEPVASVSESLTPTSRARRFNSNEPIEDGAQMSMPVSSRNNLDFTVSHQRIELTGPGVDTALVADLKAWLRQRGC